MKVRLNDADAKMFALEPGETVSIYGHSCTMVPGVGLVAEMDSALASLEIGAGRFAAVPEEEPAAPEELEKKSEQPEGLSEEDILYVTHASRTKKELIDFAHTRCNGLVLAANMSKEQMIEVIMRFAAQ